jgi:hypothetical protein
MTRAVENDRRARLRGVEALIFDVFGTVVDWFGSVTAELREFGRGKNFSGLCTRNPDIATQIHWNSTDSEDWQAFAKEWRQGYLETTSVLQAIMTAQLMIIRLLQRPRFDWRDRLPRCRRHAQGGKHLVAHLIRHLITSW